MEETFGDGQVQLISKSVQMLLNAMLPMIHILSRNLKTTFRSTTSRKFLIKLEVTLRHVHDSDGESCDEIIDEMLFPLVLRQPLADRHPLHQQLGKAGSQLNKYFTLVSYDRSSIRQSAWGCVNNILFYT
jgi:hypothetical protein